MEHSENIEFEDIFHLYVKELYVFADRILQDSGVAEDVVQNFFIKLWYQRNSIVVGPAFRSYCYKSIYHAALNALRHNNRKVEFPDDLEVINDIEYEIERSDMRTRLDAAIKALPERCRQIFNDVCVEGYAYAEVAEKYGLSVNTVKVQISKAYRILRLRLAEGKDRLVLYMMAFRSFLKDAVSCR